MTKIVTTPAAAYLTSPNVVHPISELKSAGEPFVLGQEAIARADIGARLGVTVTGGSIQRHP